MTKDELKAYLMHYMPTDDFIKGLYAKDTRHKKILIGTNLNKYTQYLLRDDDIKITERERIRRTQCTIYHCTCNTQVGIFKLVKSYNKWVAIIINNIMYLPIDTIRHVYSNSTDRLDIHYTYYSRTTSKHITFSRDICKVIAVKPLTYDVMVSIL